LESFTTKPSSAVQKAQNTFVKTLVDGGVWSKLDALWIWAAHTNANGEAVKNWIDPTKYNGVLSATAPTFTAFEGFKGNGSSAQIDLNIAPNTAGIKYTQNAASLGVFVRKTDRLTTYRHIGNKNSTNDNVIQGCEPFSTRISGGSSFLASNTYSDYPGFVCAKRKDASTIELYSRLVKSTGAINSVGVSSGNFYALSKGDINYSTNQLSLGFIGDYLTDDDYLLFRTAVNTYMASNNKHVKTLSILGDSISVWNTQKWPTDNAVMIPWRIIDHAVTGQRVIPHMDSQVVATANDNADAIIIALGTNDLDYGDMASLQAEAEENIAELKLSNPNATIYWMNVLSSWTDITGATERPLNNVRTAIAAACTAQNIICWDTYTDPWLTNCGTDTYDGIHPSPTGNAKIWAKISSLFQ